MKNWLVLMVAIALIFGSVPIYAKGQKTGPYNSEASMSQQYSTEQGPQKMNGCE